MTRSQFLGLLTMMMGQYPPLACTEKGKVVQCVAPEPLKEGEERCPLGHGQKPDAYLKPHPIWAEPKIPERKDTEMSTNIQPFYYQARWVEPRICSVCGTVYVRLEHNNANPKP